MAGRKTARFTLFAMLMLMVGCGGTASEEVVVYTSVDDVFARPVAEQFEQATGIVVRLVRNVSGLCRSALAVSDP